VYRCRPRCCPLYREMLRMLFALACLGSVLGLQASAVDHINIIVPDAHKAALFFSKKGFTLKKPHDYSSGVQKGLSSQSIHFSSHQYIQLMSLSSKESKLGALALWYQGFLKDNNKAQGLGLVLKNSNLKELNKKLLKKGIPNKFKDLPNYKWLSFKTGSDLQHVSFIDPKKYIQRSEALTNHQNKARAIKTIFLKLKGDARQWATIFQQADALSLGLEFSSMTYTSSGIIQKVILESTASPCPESFEYDQIAFSYSCQEDRVKAK